MSGCYESIFLQENPHDFAITTNCNIFKIHNLEFHCKQSSHLLMAEPNNRHHLLHLIQSFSTTITLNSKDYCV